MSKLLRVLAIILSGPFVSCSQHERAAVTFTGGHEAEWVINGKKVDRDSEIDEVTGLILSEDERGNIVRSCSAVIVAPTTILTAAHCAVGNGSRWFVPGSRPLKEIGIPVELTPHPDYRKGYGDIAAGKLAASVPKGFKPVEVFEGRVSLGEKVIFAGFGWTSTENPSMSDKLRKGDGQITSLEKVDQGEFTFLGQGEFACYGDSGGPVFVKGKHGLQLAGLISRAAYSPDRGKSACGLPAVVTSVSFFVSFFSP